MDTHIGEKEINTQKRLIQLFEKRLGYTYLGDWKDREGNSNIEEVLLREYLVKTGKYKDAEINSTLHKLKIVADNIAVGLYNANKEVYRMLRYGSM